MLPPCTREYNALDFQEHFDFIIELLESEGGPFMITNNDGQTLMIFEWDNFWNRFASVFPPGEKERVEAECIRLIK